MVCPQRQHMHTHIVSPRGAGVKYYRPKGTLATQTKPASRS